ncbi:uncharacterized protein LOC126320471 [Schistocerca gregaria]|uniref:uncharacterized protein LOC126320471 n=1 Tax=Schistocerca gregaria TaxID=7010 RepID=UPI00211DDDA2|nr:uncharacterized protein LOC126320471 [Schistocerca gregaria]
MCLGYHQTCFKMCTAQVRKKKMNLSDELIDVEILQLVAHFLKASRLPKTLKRLAREANFEPLLSDVPPITLSALYEFYKCCLSDCSKEACAAKNPDRFCVVNPDSDKPPSSCPKDSASCSGCAEETHSKFGDDRVSVDDSPLALKNANNTDPSSVSLSEKSAMSASDIDKASAYPDVAADKKRRHKSKDRHKHKTPKTARSISTSANEDDTKLVPSSTSKSDFESDRHSILPSVDSLASEPAPSDFAPSVSNAACAGGQTTSCDDALLSSAAQPNSTKLDDMKFPDKSVRKPPRESSFNNEFTKFCSLVKKRKQCSPDRSKNVSNNYIDESVDYEKDTRLRNANRYRATNEEAYGLKASMAMSNITGANFKKEKTKKKKGSYRGGKISLCVNSILLNDDGNPE